MNILLGNLELDAIVKPEYLPKVQSFLEDNGFQRETFCDEVESKLGNYHIYDMPRQIHICGEDKTQQFIKFLQDEDLVAKAFIGRVGVAPLPLTHKD